MVDYRKSALVHMMSQETGNIEFVLQIYGVWGEELMTVPNPIIQKLAGKYPNHMATPFMVEDGGVRVKARVQPQIIRTKLERLF